MNSAHDDLAFGRGRESGAAALRRPAGLGHDALDGLAQFGATPLLLRQLGAQLLFPGLEIGHHGFHPPAARLASSRWSAVRARRRRRLDVPARGPSSPGEGILRLVVDALGLRLAVAAYSSTRSQPPKGLGHAFGVEHHLPPIVAPTKSGGDANHLRVFFLERLQLTIGLADPRLSSFEGGVPPPDVLPEGWPAIVGAGPPVPSAPPIPVCCGPCLPGWHRGAIGWRRSVPRWRPARTRGVLDRRSGPESFPRMARAQNVTRRSRLISMGQRPSRCSMSSGTSNGMG